MDRLLHLKKIARAAFKAINKTFRDQLKLGAEEAPGRAAFKEMNETQLKLGADKSPGRAAFKEMNETLRDRLKLGGGEAPVRTAFETIYKTFRDQLKLGAAELPGKPVFKGINETLRNQLKLGAAEAPGRDAFKVICKTLGDQLKLGAVEAPKYVNHVKEEIVYKKLAKANAWYTRVLGLDEVKFYQQRVVTLQEKLLDVQEKRREIAQQLADVQRKSNELDDQINKAKPQEDLQQFLDLRKEKNEILKRESEIKDTFNRYDREEREVFAAFTTAVKVSHEKQWAQMEYTKYFGLILSLVGSFLAFVYWMIRKRDLEKFIHDRFGD